VKLGVPLPATDMTREEKEQLINLIVLGELLGQDHMVNRLTELLLHVLVDRKQKWTAEEVREVVRKTTPRSAARRVLLYLPWYHSDQNTKQNIPFATVVESTTASGILKRLEEISKLDLDLSHLLDMAKNE
jgi:hypothetical protein